MRGRLLGYVLTLALATACSDGVGPPRAQPTALPTTTAATAPPPLTRGPTPASRPTAIPPLPGAPPEFYGVLGGRVAAFDATTGQRLRFLTDPPSGSYDGSLSVIDADGSRSVVFVRGSDGTPCGERVLRVPAAGGAATAVPGVPRGIVVTSVAADRAGTRLAYAYTRCGSDDTRPRLRVVSLPGGRTLAEARSTFQGNGVVSVNALAVAGDLVAAGLGLHLQSWQVVLDTRRARARTDLDSLPELPRPDGCQVDGGGVWTTRAGTPALMTTELCEPTLAHRLVTYWGPGLRRRAVRELAASPDTAYVTGGDQAGRLIGRRGTDTEQRYEMSVFQWADGRQRVLPACTEPRGSADACVQDPVW